MKIRVVLFLCFLGTKTLLGQTLPSFDDVVDYNNSLEFKDLYSNYTDDDFNKALTSLDDRDYDISLEDAETEASDVSGEIQKLQELAYILQISRDGHLATDDLSQGDWVFLRKLDISTYEDLSTQTDSIIENAMDAVDSLQGRIDEVMKTIQQNMLLDEQDSDTRRALLSAYEIVSEDLDTKMKQIQVLTDDVDNYRSMTDSSDPALSLFPPVGDLFSENADNLDSNLTDPLENSYYDYGNDTGFLSDEGYENYQSEKFGNDTSSMDLYGDIENVNVTDTEDSQYLDADALQSLPEGQLFDNEEYDLLDSYDSLPNISSPETFDTKESDNKKSLGYFLNSPDKTSDQGQQTDSIKPVDIIDLLDDYETTGYDENTNNENETIDDVDVESDPNNDETKMSMDSFNNTKDSDLYEGVHTMPLPGEFDSGYLQKQINGNIDNSQYFDSNEDMDLLIEDNYNLNELDLSNIENAPTDLMDTEDDPTYSDNNDNSFTSNLLNQDQNRPQDIEENINDWLNSPSSNFDFSNLVRDSSIVDVPENQPDSDDTVELYDEVYNSIRENEDNMINDKDEITDNGKNILNRIFSENKFGAQLFVNNPSESNSVDEEERTNQYISALEELDQELNSEDLSSNDNFILDPQSTEWKNTREEKQLLNIELSKENDLMKDEMQKKKAEEDSRLSRLQLALIITAAGVPVLLIIALVLYTTMYRCKQKKMPYKVMQDDDVFDKKINPAEGGKDDYSVSV